MADHATNPIGLTHRNILTIFLAAIAVRLINAASIDDITIYAFAGDSPIYWEGARAWLESGYFSRAVADGFVDETERVPFYNLFLLPFRWAFGEAIWPVVVAQSFLDSMTCALIGLIGSQLTRTTGLVAGLLAAGWPNLVIHSHLILSDSLFLFLFSGMLYFASKYLRTARITDAIIVGSLCGAAIMTRSIALYIPISMAFCAPFIARRALGKWTPGIGAGIAMLCASLIIISPLLWRNVNTYGSFQLTAQGGSHFLNWVVGYVNSYGRGTTFTEEARNIRGKLRAQIEAGERRVDETNPFAVAASQVAFARQEFKNLPLQTILRAWIYGAAINVGAPAIATEPRIGSYNRKSLMDSPGTTLTDRLSTFLTGNHPTYLVWVTIGLIASVLCTALQFGGWFILLRTAFWPAIFGALAVIYFLLITGPVGAPKYRLPFEPILIVFQSVALIMLYKFFRTRRQTSGDAP